MLYYYFFMDSTIYLIDLYIKFIFSSIGYTLSAISMQLDISILSIFCFIWIKVISNSLFISIILFSLKLSV